MSSAWNWIRDFYQNAERDGDEKRLQLLDYHQRGFEVGHERPDERLAIYDAGRALAARLGEPWWEMFFEHWKIETLLFSKQDARGALDLAARAVLEVAKPNYANLPERASLNLNLVSAYMQLDIVSTWPALHEPMVAACARAGVKLIYCEEPTAPTEQFSAEFMLNAATQEFLFNRVL